MSTELLPLDEFLKTKTEFSYSTFEETLINSITTNKGQFPNIQESQVSIIVNGILHFYQGEFRKIHPLEEKQNLISKLKLLLDQIEHNSLYVFSFKGINGYDSFIMNLLFERLTTSLSYLIKEQERKIQEGNFQLPQTKSFSYAEVLNLIHAFRHIKLFRPEISNHEISDAFQQLTGFATDSLKNKLSNNAFSKDKALINSRKELIAKLHEMIMFLESKK